MSSFIDIDLLLKKVALLLDRTVDIFVLHVPQIEETVWKLIQTMFNPSTILNQLAIITFLQCAILSWDVLGNAADYLLMRFTEVGRQKLSILKGMKSATCYRDWCLLARQVICNNLDLYSIFVVV